jgi:hypothetical protein
MVSGAPSRKGLTRSDQRTASRFFVSTPVRFTWDSQTGIETIDGVTRDVSIQSLFIWSNELPPVGTAVHCRVFLPAPTPDSPPIRFDLTGPVIRTELPPPEHRMFGFVVLGHNEPHFEFPNTGKF